MNTDEKLRRALADDWEFVGDPHSLCRLLRAEVLRLREKIRLAECQYLGCGGRLKPDEIISAMRGILNDD